MKLSYLNPYVQMADITDELIWMTPWEIHYTGIQVVRAYLANNGWTITSWQNDMAVDP
jgi:hypothetical protein